MSRTCKCNLAETPEKPLVCSGAFTPDTCGCCCTNEMPDGIMCVHRPECHEDSADTEYLEIPAFLRRGND